MYECDLHSHTVRSDGNDTYAELIDKAGALGIRVLAITDHDVVCDGTLFAEGAEQTLEDYGLRRGVRVLRGIEFSCDTDVEDVHIVALGCDFGAPFFAREHERSIVSKIDGYKALCARLTGDGMPVDWARDILEDGRRDERAVQRKQIFEAMARKGYAASWSDAKLLVKNTPRYAVRRIKPDPSDIIRGIHETGGVAILAHPFLITPAAGDEVPPGFREAYIERLIAAGLDGIEASYPYDKTSYGGALTPEEIETQVRAAYGARLEILSGGSDYHDEGKKGSKNPRMLGERGVTLAYFASNPLLSRLPNA